MNTTCNQLFITDDFEIIPFDFENLEKYEFTSRLKTGELSMKNYDFHGTQDEFTQWANENLSLEELYEIPMMNTLYYFPSFVILSEQDRHKNASSTTVLFDKELNAWGIGMTGGGMDLAPHLLDTFIKLERGVPLNIAKSISPDYNAYISADLHQQNCQMLSKAFQNLSEQMIGYSFQLKETTP